MMTTEKRHSWKKEPSRNPLSNSCGFTLLEVVIVLVIGSVLLSIAILGMQDIVRRNAAEELISHLNLARMTAIRRHRPVRVDFTPDTTQCTISVNSDVPGVVDTRVIDLGTTGERYVFDSTPPGGGATLPPDIAFIFTPLGFIRTDPGGNAPGNIYLSNQDDSRNFQIQTTIAGGIQLNRFGAGAWNPAF